MTRWIFYMIQINKILIIVCCLFSSAVQGQDYTFLVGGGDKPSNSQVQIELNVKWIEGILRDSGYTPRIFFTDGQAPEPDVLTHTGPEDDAAATLEPLARIMGEYGDNYLAFRNNEVPNIEASTDATKLSTTLKEAFASMRPGDRIFFIYQGHGTWEKDSGNNALLLWNHTRLSAVEFQELLDALDPGVQFRFFFPQCFSGAFLRLADASPLAYKDSTQAAQCGFTAVSATKPSEGCTVSLKADDFRDYSTYFFAALDGKTRLGKPLNGSADENGDGAISLHEAHMYSLDNAYSTDLSRSTSEDFLEQWQPWYLKWKADIRDIPDNLFGKRAHRIAAINSYTGEGPALKKRLFKQRKQFVEAVESLHAKQADLETRQSQLHEELKARLLNHWPELMLPYTAAYKALMDNQLDTVLEWIDAQEDYHQLAAMQDENMSRMKDLLDLQRKITQIDKIFRMIQLSRILEQLKVYGREEDLAAYQRLLSCEDNPL